jgi:lysyl-tRNA synthetase class II
MMELIESMVTTIAQKVFGTLQIKLPGDKVINLERPWRRAPYRDLVRERTGRQDWFELPREEKYMLAKDLGAQVMPDWTDLEITHEIYEKLIEHTLIQPTFVTRLPAVPSVLIECGFLSNPEDERKLQEPAYQQLLAEGIADGVLQYLQNKEPSGPEGS